MKLQLSDIVQAISASRCEPSTKDVQVTGMTWDSRRVTPGDLYVAIPGEHADGADFAADAVSAGASAVLALRDLDLSVPVIVAEDIEQALYDLAKFWRERLNATVIGVTGSSGKTTTKNFISAVLQQGCDVVATSGNANNELGVPATLLAADTNTQALVVEMGMRGLGQIEALAKCASPNWGLITNVGSSHIGILKSIEAIARAKGELFEALPDGTGVAFINADNEHCLSLCESTRLKERGIQTVFFSRYEPYAPDQACVWSSECRLDERGCAHLKVHAQGFDRPNNANDEIFECLTLNLPGMHNVSNALAACAVGLRMGLSLALCCDALENILPSEGRSHIATNKEGLTIVDDAYNANPDSMSASLETFSAMKLKGKRVAVLGDMLELGDEAEQFHKDIGRQAGLCGLDYLICVGQFASAISDGAQEASMPADSIYTCDDADEAFTRVKSLLGPDDAVLIKASHAVGLESVVKRLVD